MYVLKLFREILLHPKNSYRIRNGILELIWT